MIQIKKTWNSFQYAFQGIKATAKAENNFRFHLLATLVVVAGGLWVKLSRLEWCAILICIGLVLCCEMINTAIEQLVDFVSPQRNQKAGAIKDIAAGVVLVATGTAVVTGLLIFWPYLLVFLKFQ